jgi:hypothetical protein
MLSFSQIMSYVLCIMICVGMILLDNLVQCLIFIAIMDLSKTYDNIAISIYKLLAMFMSCF